jgi:hypothetical protein
MGRRVSKVAIAWLMLATGCYGLSARVAELPFGDCAKPRAGTDLADADFSNADVWDANFSGALNRPPSVIDALVGPFVASERR